MKTLKYKIKSTIYFENKELWIFNNANSRNAFFQ